MKRLSIHVSPTHETISFMNRRATTKKKWKSKFCVGAFCRLSPTRSSDFGNKLLKLFSSRGMEFYCLRASCDCFHVVVANLHTRFTRSYSPTTASPSIFGFCRHSNVEDRENARSRHTTRWTLLQKYEMWSSDTPNNRCRWIFGTFSNRLAPLSLKDGIPRNYAMFSRGHLFADLHLTPSLAIKLFIRWQFADSHHGQIASTQLSVCSTCLWRSGRGLQSRAVDKTYDASGCLSCGTLGMRWRGRELDWSDLKAVSSETAGYAHKSMSNRMLQCQM